MWQYLVYNGHSIKCHYYLSKVTKLSFSSHGTCSLKSEYLQDLSKSWWANEFDDSLASVGKLSQKGKKIHLDFLGVFGHPGKRYEKWTSLTFFHMCIRFSQPNKATSLEGLDVLLSSWAVFPCSRNALRMRPFSWDALDTFLVCLWLLCFPCLSFGYICRLL